MCYLIVKRQGQREEAAHGHHVLDGGPETDSFEISLCFSTLEQCAFFVCLFVCFVFKEIFFACVHVCHVLVVPVRVLIHLWVGD